MKKIIKQIASIMILIISISFFTGCKKESLESTDQTIDCVFSCYVCDTIYKEKTGDYTIINKSYDIASYYSLVHNVDDYYRLKKDNDVTLCNIGKAALSEKIKEIEKTNRLFSKIHGSFNQHIVEIKQGDQIQVYGKSLALNKFVVIEVIIYSLSGEIRSQSINISKNHNTLGVFFNKLI